MRTIRSASLALRFVVLLVSSVPIAAAARSGEHENSAGGDCRTIQGNLDETSIYTLEPSGRVVGNASGALEGSETGIRTSQVFDPGSGNILITTLNQFVTGPGDMLVATGVGVFKPISPTDVLGTITLTIDSVSSSGHFAGATGTIVLDGGAHNVLGPGAGAGTTTFQFHYKGNLCSE